MIRISTCWPAPCFQFPSSANNRKFYAMARNWLRTILYTFSVAKIVDHMFRLADTAWQSHCFQDCIPSPPPICGHYLLFTRYKILWNLPKLSSSSCYCFQQLLICFCKCFATCKGFQPAIDFFNCHLLNLIMNHFGKAVTRQFFNLHLHNICQNYPSKNSDSTSRDVESFRHVLLPLFVLQMCYWCAMCTLCRLNRRRNRMRGGVVNL